MSDAFLEVQDQMQRERLAVFWRRYGNIILAFIIAVIALTAAVSIYKHWDEGVRKAQTDQFYALTDDEAFPANVLIADVKMRDGLKALLFMRAGGAALAQDDTQMAAQFYNAVLDLPETSSLPYHGLARLMMARLQPDDTRTMLEPLASDNKSIWRGAALLELAAYEGGVHQDYDKALTYLGLIQTVPGTVPSIVNKAQALEHVYTLQRDKLASK